MGKQLVFREKIPKTVAIPTTGGFHLPSRPTPSRLSLETVALGASTGFNLQRLRKDKLWRVDELWDLDTVDGSDIRRENQLRWVD